MSAVDIKWKEQESKYGEEFGEYGWQITAVLYHNGVGRIVSTRCFDLLTIER